MVKREKSAFPTGRGSRKKGSLTLIYRKKKGALYEPFKERRGKGKEGGRGTTDPRRQMEKKA